jgi:lysophospholipid acyltransferase (LPLAT)-like uncharacterized protein
MAGEPNRQAALLEFLAEHIGPVFIRSLGITLRVTQVGLEHVSEAKAATGNTLFAFWHGRLLPLVYVHRNQGINVLVSTHQDGEYIARVIHGLGFGTSRGSSTRGGIRALRELMQAGNARLDLAITPDGPKGPREKVQPGVVYLAKRLGLPVIPIGASSRPSIRAGSWDRFMVPLPFARCTVVYGRPVVFDDSVSAEAIDVARTDLERRIEQVTREADDRCGHERE